MEQAFDLEHLELRDLVENMADQLFEAVEGRIPGKGAVFQPEPLKPLSLNEPVYLSVFYSREGQVLKYCLDLEYAEDSHYEFSADEGEKLRKELSVNRTLPEALADEMPSSCTAVESLLRRYGVRFQAYHYN